MEKDTSSAQPASPPGPGQPEPGAGGGASEAAPVAPIPAPGLNDGDGDGLGPAVEALEADPGNLSTWLRVATRLHDDAEAAQTDRIAAREALDSVAAALGEAGQLPMAIVACLRLAERGEERLAWARLMVLGNAYGKTSSRVDPSVRPRPPAPPRAVTPAEAGGAGGPELRARAVTALRKAAAHALAVQQAAAAQSRELREPLPPVPLFSALLPESFVKLAHQLTVVELPAGTRILTAGEIGDTLYIVARGTVRIEREDGAVLARLRSGSFFGEMSLLTAARRSAHALAETQVLLLKAERGALEQLSAADEAIATVLAEHARRRLLQNVMLTSQLFHDLDPLGREQLMSLFSFRTYEPGDLLIEDGQIGTELMVVVAGKAEVARRQAPGASVLVPIATLGLGDVIGEISLLTQRPTMALVHAIDHMAVLVLRREDFEAVVSHYPRVRETLQSLASQRLKDSREEVPSARLVVPQILIDEEELDPLLV